MRRDLTPLDYWTLMHCWVLLLQADLALRLLPFNRLQRFSERPVRIASRSAEASAAEVWRLDRLVRIAARHHLYPMTCLRRSLVLQWLLRRSGIPAELKLGVRREGQGISAHAWIEYLGEPVGEAEGIEQYAALQLSEQPR